MAREEVAAPRRARLDRRTWLLDSALLAAAAVLIRLPAFLSSRALSYDDGFFGLVATEMRHGEVPYRDLFTPQGPLHFVFLFSADLLGFRSSQAPRLLPLVAGAGVVVATYAVGRQITSRAGAVIAAVLVGTSGSVLWSTAGIAADGPAMVLSIAAVAVAFAYGRHPSTGRAAASGLLLGAGIVTKALIAPAGIAVALLLLSRRRPRDLGAAVASALAIGIAAAIPFGPADVWDQSVTYHRSSARVETYWGAVDKVVTTLFERDLTVLVAGAVTLVALLVGRLLGRRRALPVIDVDTDADPVGLPFLRRPEVVLGAWAVTQFAFLIAEPGLWRPHVAHLIAPLALLIALRPPPLIPLVVALVVVLPWHYDHVQPMLWPDDWDRTEQAALDRIGALPPDARVITDDPGLVWRARRRTDPALADSSIKRIEQGEITRGRLQRAAEQAGVCGVLVTTERYRDLALGPGLAHAGYDAEPLGPGTVWYERSGCRV